ncbi:MAG: UbiA prenyltransferase family protein [Phycisphaerales bacterium]|nr:UbiA prenyltransferase family protein [Phycisphaerales bacterium]
MPTTSSQNCCSRLLNGRYEGNWRALTMIKNYLRLMRPSDWVKNVFILPALIFSLPNIMATGQSEQLGGMVTATIWTIVAFSLLASGFYCINDALDAELDRQHPVKKKRPIARGDISSGQGLGFGLVLVGVGLLVGFLINLGVGCTLATYAVLQVAYNGGFKRVMVVDAVTLAIGFSLRAAAGAFAINVAVSAWLLGLGFFLTLYLAFIKRLCDLSTARSADSSWKSPAGYDNPLELNWLLSLSGVTVVLSWVLYSLSSHAMALFQVRATGFALLTPLVLIVVHRFYRRANNGESDSPLSALREDRVVLICMIFFVIGVLASLYVPAVQEGLSKLIYQAPVDVAGDGA